MCTLGNDSVVVLFFPFKLFSPHPEPLPMVQPFTGFPAKCSGLDSPRVGGARDCRHGRQGQPQEHGHFAGGAAGGEATVRRKGNLLQVGKGECVGFCLTFYECEGRAGSRQPVRKSMVE